MKNIRLTEWTAVSEKGGIAAYLHTKIKFVYLHIKFKQHYSSIDNHDRITALVPKKKIFKLLSYFACADPENFLRWGGGGGGGGISRPGMV